MRAIYTLACINQRSVLEFLRRFVCPAGAYVSLAQHLLQLESVVCTDCLKPLLPMGIVIGITGEIV